MLTLFQFVSMAFPKAGILIGDIPITASTIMFGVTLVYIRKSIFTYLNTYKRWTLTYFCFVFFVLLSILVNYSNITPYQIAVALVIAVSPLSVAIGYEADISKAYRITGYALIIVGVYAITQFLFGLQETTIAGLNIAWGDSFANKPIAKYGNLVKFPSTYQNGNLSGAFLALAVPFVLSWKPVSMNLRIFRNISCCFGLVGLFLSGARASLLPFAVLFPFIIFAWLKQQSSYRRRLFFIFSFLLSSMLIVSYLLFSHSEALLFMFDRYVVQTLSDPTATGRLPMWSNFLNRILQFSFIELLQFILVGLSWSSNGWQEGLLYILSIYGLIAFICFCFILIYPITKIFRGNRLIALGLFSVFIQFLGDSPFAQPPTLINFFFIVGVGLQHNKSPREDISTARISRYKRYKTRRCMHGY